MTRRKGNECTERKSLLYLPRNVTMLTNPCIDSAGGKSMVLQKTVIKLTKRMMEKVTMGPQWKTLA